MERHMEKIREERTKSVKGNLKTEGKNLSHQLVVAREGEEFLVLAKLRLPDRDVGRAGSGNLKSSLEAQHWRVAEEPCTSTCLKSHRYRMRMLP